MKRTLIIVFAALAIISACFMLACSKEPTLYPLMEIEDGKIAYKFYNEKMQVALAESYDDIVSNFEGSYAVVFDENKIQIINKEGKAVVNDEFDSVADIYGDRAILNKAGKNILYDLKTQQALVTADYIKAESNGIMAYMEGSKWGYRTISQVIKEPTYDEAYSFGNKFAVATLDGRVVRVDKEGNESPLAYDDVLNAGDSNYLIGVKNEQIDLLNFDGDPLYVNVQGDIVDIHYELLVINKRVGSSIKSGIYSVTGKELAPIEYDDIRLLSKDYFSARKKDGFALFKIDGTRLSEYKYSYLNADDFDKNGGIICAIKDGSACFLDKNGREIDAPTAENVSDVKKDQNFYIISTANEVLYFNKDKDLVKTSLVPKPLGHLSYIIKDDYPYLLSQRLPANTNENLRAAIDEITKGDKKVSLSIRGDIVMVQVKTPQGEPTFMYDISLPGKVEFADLFNQAKMKDKLIEMSAFKDEPGLEIVSFVLQNDLDVYFKKSGKFLKETFKYEDIDDYIDKDQATFFKSVLAPSINVGK